ncbi:hypothetical protein AB0L64_06060 [Kribbella sp. NPDC051936]|uniref:hypothetical protein n=1 Tax=Kribbella sp. NPDC051936 TaxID=3154946 RepID=UPI00342ECF84
MEISEFGLVGGVPPRAVDALTTVTGHQVSDSGRQAFCQCGQREPADWHGSRSEWRISHLKTAWPLLSRSSGEAKQQFLGRLSQLYVEASKLEQGIDESLGLNRPVSPGQAFPSLTNNAEAAAELVEVLRHQMESVRDSLLDTAWRE